MPLSNYLFKFFEECKISQTNQKIVIGYLESFEIEKDVSEVTLRNQEEIMKHVLRQVTEDLDNLTEVNIKKYMISVSKLTRIRDGQPASKGTKKMYRAGFAQFLRWVAKEYKKPEYKEFAEGLKFKVKVEGKKPSDLLTKEEIDRMINMAEHVRDQAILSVLAESGCRVGELVSSYVKDAQNVDGFLKLTFRGKTGIRTVPLKESLIYVNRWLEVHPLKNNPNTPLWVSLGPIPSKLGDPSKGKGYKKMQTSSVRTIVHKIADKAGIQKRVYVHLFRHTCATQLARDNMSEPMMRAFLGWDRNSNMPSIYCHLSGQDLEEAQRKRFGLAKEKELDPIIKICPRCKSEMPARTEFCMTCGEPLKQDKLKTLEEGMKAIVSDEIRSFVEEMFYENPDKFAAIRTKLQPQK